MSHHPHRQVNYGRAETELTRLQDGTILMRSPEQLGSYPDKLTEKIDHWAKAAPGAASWRSGMQKANGGG